MKYSDIDVVEAREVCKAFHKKDKRGFIHSDCDHCPLRRTRTDKEGNIRLLFCWYILQKTFKDIKEEMEELNKMDIQYEKEWKEWIEQTNKTVL